MLGKKPSKMDELIAAKESDRKRVQRGGVWLDDL